MKSRKVDYYHALIEFYTLLAKVYEKQELYNKALEAARNSLKYETRLFDKNSNKTIQKLRTQYNLNEKERVVEQLSAINERTDGLIFFRPFLLFWHWSLSFYF